MNFSPKLLGVYSVPSYSNVVGSSSTVVAGVMIGWTPSTALSKDAA